MYTAVVVVLFTLLLAVLVQLFLRVRWLAVALCLLLCGLWGAMETAAFGSGCTLQASIAASSVGALGSILFVTTLFRGGLLMAFMAFIAHILIRHAPLISEPSSWYVRSDVIPLGLLVLLMFYGYRTAAHSEASASAE